ncbi:protein SMG9 [Tribolium madens]|uniref:protein SMG9 n=1 Tax=Tribolium madens TaxID=41895 RepID=UPI001CF7242C|nr:protein SMG9 [Tribolium madens]
MSDYDRGKYYGKKKFAQNKDPSSSYARSYYGRRSPSFKDSKEAPKPDTPKVKQPTILLKARDHSEETSLSPKRAQKDPELAPTAPETHAAPSVKSMTKSVKFLDESVLSENLQEFVQENSDFLVVGVVGAQGVGKSTLLNLIAHNVVGEELKKAIFRNCETPNEDFLVENFSFPESKSEIFRIQTGDDVETNRNATRGIDAFITSNRVILLDCQPFMSVAVLDDLVQSENKRSNIVSEFIPLENSGEIQGLQLTAFLMSICHVLIVVQDYFFDSNIVRFLQTAEMLKPTHSNPEDELNDHFPHLLMVHNKAQMEDFSPRKFETIQEVYNLLFEKTKLQKDSNLGLVEGEAFNVFLVPEYNPKLENIYNGHPPLEDLVKKLRAKILGAIKTPLTHVQLTEKTWLVYCSKVWENVKKSSFFIEYTKLMP